MKALFSTKSEILFYNQHPAVIQRMLDYDYLCGREQPSVAAIVNPRSAGRQKIFFGQDEIILPVYKTIEAALAEHPRIDIMVNFASQRSAYESSKQALEHKNIRTIAIIAEGIPENQTRDLIRLAKANNKWIIGPATVGALKVGAVRIGNTGGTIQNIIDAKLYRPGSVGIVTVSGGMANEVFNIVSKFADGAYEGIAIGGDQFPGSSLLDNILRLEADDNVKMHVVLGELGGKAEYEIVAALKAGRIKKPMVAWCIGTVATLFKTEVQFGHAGARADSDLETAQAKNKALAAAGAHVPKTFNDFGKEIEKVFKKYVASQKDYQAPSDEVKQLPPMDFKEAIATGRVRRPRSVVSTISDDRGEEPTYNKRDISSYADKSLGHVINALWFKSELNKTVEEFIELCLKLTADHGPAVATAHNAIVTARAGKDLVSSLVSGLLTIGPRHGGAIDGAAIWALDAVGRELTAAEFVKEMKEKGQLIMGIGHRIKTVQNPDKRVVLLKKFAEKNLKQHRYLDFALEVERETLRKKNNLILNVDGAIAVIFLDMLEESGFKADAIRQIVDYGSLNAIFVLGRSIGIIGHTIDQKRLQEGLYRHDWDDILYL